MLVYNSACCCWRWWMGCKQLWYQHAFHVKQRCGDARCTRPRGCLCVRALFGTFFAEGCVLSLSFGVRPEAMSNWSLHTFRLDSHWHARPWLSSLCHEKGKQWHRNIPPSWLRERKNFYFLSTPPPTTSLWSRLLLSFVVFFFPFEEMNFSTMATWS